MDKIKHFNQKLSLQKSLIFYVVIFVVLAFLLSGITAFLCNNLREKIMASYTVSGEKFYLTNEKGEQLGKGTYILGTSSPLTEKDEVIVFLLEVIPIVAASFYSVFCIVAAAGLFYKNKLKEPLDKLRAASEKISKNNLDFSIEYNSGDELGQLCASFEKMRATLVENFSEMWRQVEERKQLNAAFAHDLRTPLTVLKGYNEMLQTDNMQGREIAVTMGKHISRMETYINSMSHLRRLEDTQPEYRTILLQPFLGSLYDSAKVICTQERKILYQQNNTTVLQVSIDTEFVSQVCNNLIANAARYANNTVTLTFTLCNNGLQMVVSDDGKGFDKTILPKATNPYITEEKNQPEHFGLGLYICKLLCEHHGGYLKVENILNGAKVTAFFKINEN